MARILFDIPVDPDTAEWQHGHLVMEISRQIFSYAIVGQEKKLLQLRFYHLDAQDNTELAAELGNIISSDKMLTTAVEKKTFLYNFPESQLIPEQYFQTSNSKDMIALLHGDLNKGVTLSERIQGRPEYNVYQVPAEVHGLLQRSFSNSKYWHYYSIWMAAGQQQAMAATYISVLFYPNRILISATKNTQLQLLQSYVYAAAEDVAYYLLNICQQLELPADTIPVFLSGMIDAGSVLYTEIFKYFGQLSLEAFAPDTPVPELAAYPPHFFSPLLKLATCVS